MLCDGDVVKAVLPAEHDGSLVDLDQVLANAVGQLVPGLDPDSTQHCPRHLAEEGLDHVQPGTVFGREDEFEPVRDAREICPRLF